MRKFLMTTAALAALGAAAVTLGSAAQAQPYYGPGMMGGGYGYGMMGSGYGPGYGHRDGYGPGTMMGPGYGYDDGQRAYGRGPGYRGKRMCWNETDSDKGTGYYAPCEN